MISDKAYISVIFWTLHMALVLHCPHCSICNSQVSEREREMKYVCELPESAQLKTVFGSSISPYSKDGCGPPGLEFDTPVLVGILEPSRHHTGPPELSLGTPAIEDIVAVVWLIKVHRLINYKPLQLLTQWGLIYEKKRIGTHIDAKGFLCKVLEDPARRKMLKGYPECQELTPKGPDLGSTCDELGLSDSDLTVVQKTIIYTLHKEGKPQTFITKEVGCSQSAASKHVNRKLSGRKKCGRKRCTTNRENRSLERLVKQNRFKNLGELHKEWTEAGVKEFGYSCRIPLVKPLLNHRQRQRRLTWTKQKKKWTAAQWSKVLFSDESKFFISSGNQGPRVWRKGGEAHSPSCFKSSVKFPQSLMIWGGMSSAGVGPLCFLKTKQDLAPAHTDKSINSWLSDNHVGVLDCTANSPHLNPIENLWGIVKRKMRNN
ncbi:Transposable element Tc1 transposase [Labeo rohita]|uniref:Transposable element Tc1 transposase n=1 Tax=Labeo rohita TaxID=84645 RepID=A0ABQ8LQA3_LABRO|nr:Transposable element Tc1 transposase [Labeo rohita]